MSAAQESYYKILGTTANISQRRVKEKYLQAVRKYPPEEYPEEFEKIRTAYETLKDPMKRKQYDLRRKYGSKLNTWLEKAERSFALQDYKQTLKMYEKVLEIDEHNISAQLGAVLVSALLEKKQDSHRLFEALLVNPRLLEEGLTPVDIYFYYVQVLLKMDMTAFAGDILDQALKDYPEHLPAFADVISYFHYQQGDFQKAIEFAEKAIPPEAEETFADIDLYVKWILSVASTEYWSELGKAQSRFKKFLLRLEDPEDKLEAFSLLQSEYEESRYHGNFRMAEPFLELALVLEPKDQQLKEELKEVKKMVRLEKEIQRLLKDQDIFPLIAHDALIWLYERELGLESAGVEGMFPPDMVEELKHMQDYWAAGILKLKKKYPIIYKHFQTDWDRKFEELTAGFNREMKRELRKLQL